MRAVAICVFGVVVVTPFPRSSPRRVANGTSKSKESAVRDVSANASRT